MRSYWEDKIHVVVSQKGEDSPVYEVKPERGTGRSRILHRNMLMACNALPLEETAQKTAREQNPQQKKRRREIEMQELSEDSESSVEETYQWDHRQRHHHQPGNQNIEPQTTPETAPQPELSAEAEEFRMETPMQMFADNDITEYDTQEMIPTFQTAELPSNQESELCDTQPRRSQRERRPKEILTYESLGQPTHRMVGLHINPLYVSTVAPAYGQYSMPLPQMFGTHSVYPTLVPVGYC